MDNKKKGDLLQKLADNTAELQRLIMKGHAMGNDLEEIVKWMKSLGTKEPLELTFERRREELVVRINTSRECYIPEDLAGHIKKVTSLQNQINTTRKELEKELGMGEYPKYTVSIGEDANRANRLA